MIWLIYIFHRLQKYNYLLIYKIYIYKYVYEGLLSSAILALIFSHLGVDDSGPVCA